MGLAKWMRRCMELIHELERGVGSTNTSRLKSSQTVPPQEPWANRHNNLSLVAVHPMSGCYPEGQRCLEHRLVLFFSYVYNMS